VTIGCTVLAVVITTSFHTCTMQPDDELLSILTLRWVVTFIVEVRGGAEVRRLDIFLQVTMEVRNEDTLNVDA
jgi:hypothetical protein